MKMRVSIGEDRGQEQSIPEVCDYSRILWDVKSLVFVILCKEMGDT